MLCAAPKTALPPSSSSPATLPPSSSSFSPRLKHWMDYCEAHPEELSKVAAVQKKVDEVREERGVLGGGGPKRGPQEGE